MGLGERGGVFCGGGSQVNPTQAASFPPSLLPFSFLPSFLPTSLPLSQQGPSWLFPLTAGLHIVTAHLMQVCVCVDGGGGCYLIFYKRFTARRAVLRSWGWAGWGGGDQRNTELAYSKWPYLPFKCHARRRRTALRGMKRLRVEKKRWYSETFHE